MMEKARQGRPYVESSDNETGSQKSRRSQKFVQPRVMWLGLLKSRIPGESHSKDQMVTVE